MQKFFRISYPVRALLRTAAARMQKQDAVSYPSLGFTPLRRGPDLNREFPKESAFEADAMPDYATAASVPQRVLIHL